MVAAFITIVAFAVTIVAFAGEGLNAVFKLIITEAKNADRIKVVQSIICNLESENLFRSSISNPLLYPIMPCPAIIIDTKINAPIKTHKPSAPMFLVMPT